MSFITASAIQYVTLSTIPKNFPTYTDKIDRMIKRSLVRGHHTAVFTSALLVVISPRLSPRADNRRSTLIYGPIWKQPCDNL